MLTLEQVFLAAQVAACAYAFHRITQPYQILSAWGRLLNRIEERAPWLAKPLGGCETCTAGQAALWVSVFTYGIGWHNITFTLITISLTICLTRYVD